MRKFETPIISIKKFNVEDIVTGSAVLNTVKDTLEVTVDEHIEPEDISWNYFN